MKPWLKSISMLVMTVTLVFMTSGCEPNRPTLSHRYQDDVWTALTEFSKKPALTTIDLAEIVPFRWNKVYVLYGNEFGRGEESYAGYNHRFDANVYGGFWYGNRGSTFTDIRGGMGLVFLGEDGIYYDIDIGKNFDYKKTNLHITHPVNNIYNDNEYVLTPQNALLSVVTHPNTTQPLLMLFKDPFALKTPPALPATPGNK